jgi:hypothetical protein
MDPKRLVTHYLHNVEPRHRQRDVVAVTGVTPVTLQNWVNRKVHQEVFGHHSESTTKPGSKSKRLYNGPELSFIYLAKKVVDLQFEPMVAFAYSHYAITGVVGLCSDVLLGRRGALELWNDLQQLASVFDSSFKLGGGHYPALIRKTEIYSSGYSAGPLLIINTGELVLELADRVHAHVQDPVSEIDKGGFEELFEEGWLERENFWGISTDTPDTTGEG